MCGIFGYIGTKNVNLSKLLLDGLSKLEYRGYDSAGIGILTGRGFRLFRETGEVNKLKEKIHDAKVSGCMGVGHTRWATHGGVTIKNTHPHSDCSKKVIVVHNGIIENYQEIKKMLIEKGHKFRSDTDTEILAHLIEDKFKKGRDFVQSVRLSFNMLKGLNAVVALSINGKMVAIRKGSPLVVGTENGVSYISSDIPALMQFTNKIIFLEENEGVVLSKDELFVFDVKNNRKKKASPKLVRVDGLDVDKGKFKHYLKKEIFEQPEVIKRIANDKSKIVNKASLLIKQAWGTYFTACGTAAHAGLAATYMFSEIAQRHVNFTYGSEFPYFKDFLVNKSLLIAASQSGETMDTLEAVKAAKDKKSTVLGIVNVEESSLTRHTDLNIYLRAGPERAVLSTKAYTAKLAVFLMIAYTINNKYEQGRKLLDETAKQIFIMLDGNLEKNVNRLARKFVNYDHIYLIGRGVNYPTALEGALKIKEASYIHAEGFAGGELKHGVIALVEEATPCIVIVANDRAKSSTLSNAAELKARGGYIVGVSPEDNTVFDWWIKVPDVGTASPIAGIIPLQLLAYHLTVLKGLNPDKPRNLAKSVTVK